jgi:hypothetical protein
MKTRDRNILITSSAAVVGVGLAVVVALFVVVPLLKSTCVWFDAHCVDISYKQLPDGQLLVTDPTTNIAYWYDGNYIRSYGANIPGSCPDYVAPVGATGVQSAVGEARYECLAFDPEDTTVCLSRSTTPTYPLQFTGSYNPAPKHTGVAALEPAFVINAYTLDTTSTDVLCSQAREVLDTSFASAPEHHVTLPTSRNSTSVGAKQLFSGLRKRKIFHAPRADPAPPPCNGNGVVDPNTAQCVCNPGFSGSLCGTQLCTSDSQCENDGVCNGGLCDCGEGWGGSRCDQKLCVGECINGECDPVSGVCVCTPGFTGEVCEYMECAQSCRNGTCDPVTGTCACEEGYRGSACQNKQCPLACSGRGLCRADGVCECIDTYRGVGCETPVCANNCNLNGRCDVELGTCECDPEWTGESCGVPVCVNRCCTHGTCDTVAGVCECNPGWSGEDCSVPDDPLTTDLLCPGGGAS